MEFANDDEDILHTLEQLDDQQMGIDVSASAQKNSRGDMSDDTPLPVYLKCLREQFGHTAFRPYQWNIIRSVLIDRRDNCVVMATGYGKSLCFQFPSVFANGVTVVVSPLISLMQDQVLALNVANIPACLLGSAQTDRGVLERARNGEYRLVYLSPEYLSTSLEVLQALGDRLILIAIDEAHCVSQWGHDFRQCYRTLGRIRQTIPDVPILAVTATATEQVRNDICSSLLLRRPQILCTGFDRPNLEFIVRPKTSPWPDLSVHVSGIGVPQGSIIVYCLTRKVTEHLAELLTSHGVQCAAYHAGLSISRRHDIHERFVRDKLQVIVATVAFGMGIDKPDVRLVIHYGASKDIESYYQEVGRAGRDGQPSKCVMFTADSDFDLHATLREMSKISNSVKTNLERLSTQMKQFVRSDKCRRLYILQYFEGPSAKCEPRANCCDNCRRPPPVASEFEGINADGEFDFRPDAELLLGAIDLFQGYAGLAKPIQVLRGSNTAALKKYSQHQLHGVGKFKSEAYWKQLAEMLETEQLICKSRRTVAGGYPYSVVQLTHGGTNVLNSQKPMWLKVPRAMMQFMRKKVSATALDKKPASVASASTTSVGAEKTSADRLATALMLCRTNLATRYDAMPYVIASNAALEQLARVQPLSVAELTAAGIDGMSDAKIRQFGNDFVQCIRQHKLATEKRGNDCNNGSSMIDALQQCPMPDVRVGAAQLRVVPYLNYASLNQISAELDLKATTISTYIVNLIKSGHPVTRSVLNRLFDVDAQTFKAVESALPKDDDEALMRATLRPLKESLPDHITYDQIKMVLSYVQVRQHLRAAGVPFVDPDEQVGQSDKVSIDSPPDTNTIDAEPVNWAEFGESINVAELLEDVNLFSSDATPPPPKTVESVDDPDMWAGDEFDNDLADTMTQFESCSGSNQQISNSNPSQPLDDKQDDGLAALIDEPATIPTARKHQPPKCVPNKRIMYDSDSTDDELPASESGSIKPDGESKRKLPSWMLERPASTVKIVKIDPKSRARKQNNIF